MKIRYIGPGNSLPWRNDTGQDVDSDSIVPFGGGLAAITQIPVRAGEIGQVAMSGIYELDLPDGLSLSRGDPVFATNGQIAASGDALGYVVARPRNGRVRVRLLPVLTVGGAGGDTLSVTLTAGEGIAVTSRRTAQGLEYTVALDLSLESESDNLTITQKGTP